MSEPNILICSVALVCSLAAIAATFAAKRWSCALAFISIALLYFLGNTAMPESGMWFWGAASLIGWGINTLLPSPVMYSRQGLGYIAGGALAGTAVGLLLPSPWLVLGTLAGCFCGALAFSRTPRGKSLPFPSKPFLNYLCAKGLPATVVMCVAGIVLIHSFLN